MVSSQYRLINRSDKSDVLFDGNQFRRYDKNEHVPKCNILIMDSAFFVRMCSRTGLRTSHSTWLMFYRNFFKEHPLRQHESHLMPKVGMSDYEAFAMLEVECGKVKDQR
jgi:hypothetical protein